MDHVGALLTAYCTRAGAMAPAPREDGSYALHFENVGLIEFSSFGDRDGVMLRAAFPAPQQEDKRREALRWLMCVNLILAGRKRATLTIDAATDTPFLYDVQTIDPANLAAGHRMIVTFVNEAAAFRSLLTRAH
jgi:hypothetical protein